MASRLYLVARVGSPQLLLWDSERGESRSGPTEYEDVLVAVFDREPAEGELRLAMAGIQGAVAEADDHADVHSHALMDEVTWGRFGSPQRGALEALHGTGLGAVIHFHHSLEEALQTGDAAGATFVAEGPVEPTRDEDSPREPG